MNQHIPNFAHLTEPLREILKRILEKCPKRNIRQASRFALSDFGWNDVGSWSAVYELTDKDAAGNALQSIYHTIAGSNNNLLMSGGEKMIALVGMENTAVIETNDAILICNLNHSQGKASCRTPFF